MSIFKKHCDQIFQSMVSYRTENNEKLNMYKLMISKGEETYSYSFYDEKNLCEIRSISKLIVCLAVGIAIDKKVEINGCPINLDMKIWPLIKHCVKLSNTDNLKFLEKITLKHLLNHTMGFDKGLMFSSHIKNIPSEDLIDYVFNSGISHEPGEFFVYSNAGAFTFSVIIQEVLGKNLSQWVNELLFKEIDIHNYQWTNYGKYCAGATGLSLTIEDLHKIGVIIAKKGVYSGKRIISEEWINLIMSKTVNTSKLIDPNQLFPKEGYGYGLWISREGKVCYCSGTDGQYVIVIPDADIVISTLGNENDMKAITDCMKPIIEEGFLI